MSILRYALAGSIVACFACGVAAAQVTPTPPPASSATQSATPDQNAPSTSMPGDHGLPVTAASATAAGSNASVTVDANGNRHVLVANPPIPDTAENRAKYGHPLSNAGRRTEPAGN